jgi:hypothetical protein
VIVRDDEYEFAKSILYHRNKDFHTSMLEFERMHGVDGFVSRDLAVWLVDAVISDSEVVDDN